MLPVNPNSKLSAQDFVDQINKTSCLPDWIKKIFSAGGHEIKIDQNYTLPPRTVAPAWFKSWHNAALSAINQDEWELTTGSLELKPKGLSIMIPDGVSIGKTDPNGNWTSFPQIGADDTGTGGITVPTQSIKNDLNADKDVKLHYDSVIVKPTTGKQRGSIVVVDRMKQDGGQTFPMNATDIAGTFFHEMFHAGQISQGSPNSHKDDRFQKIIEVIGAQFEHCSP